MYPSSRASRRFRVSCDANQDFSHVLSEIKKVLSLKHSEGEIRGKLKKVNVTVRVHCVFNFSQITRSPLEFSSKADCLPIMFRTERCAMETGHACGSSLQVMERRRAPGTSKHAYTTQVGVGLIAFKLKCGKVAHQSLPFEDLASVPARAPRSPLQLAWGQISAAKIRENRDFRDFRVYVQELVDMNHADFICGDCPDRGVSGDESQKGQGASSTRVHSLVTWQN